MQLPKESAHYSRTVALTRYVGRRLRRSGKTSVAKDTIAAGALVREMGRAWEDADDLVQEALADRDGADDDLDGIAQDGRANIGGRSATAMKEEPYTLVFPEGVAYYTAAPLDQEETRYSELSERIVAHLPANDPVRKTAPAAIKKGLAAFKAASQELDKAERARSMARTELDRAVRNAHRQLEKVYGAILSEDGKAAAEAFFPKAARNKGKDEKPGDSNPEE